MSSKDKISLWSYTRLILQYFEILNYLYNQKLTSSWMITENENVYWDTHMEWVIFKIDQNKKKKHLKIHRRDLQYFHSCHLVNTLGKLYQPGNWKGHVHRWHMSKCCFGGTRVICSYKEMRHFFYISIYLNKIYN